MKRTFAPFALCVLLAALLAAPVPSGGAEKPPKELWDEFPLEQKTPAPTPQVAESPQATPAPSSAPKSGDDGAMPAGSLVLLLVGAAGLGGVAVFTASRRMRAPGEEPEPAPVAAPVPATGRFKRQAKPDAAPAAPAAPAAASSAANGHVNGHVRPDQPTRRKNGAAPRAKSQRARDTTPKPQRARDATPKPAAEPPPPPVAAPDAPLAAAAEVAAPKPAAKPRAKRAPTKRAAKKAATPAKRARTPAKPKTRRAEPAPEPVEAPLEPVPPAEPPARPRPQRRPAPVPAPEVVAEAADETYPTCRIKLHNRPIRAHFYAVPYEGGPVLARSPYFKLHRGDDEGGPTAPDALRALVEELHSLGWRQTGVGSAPWDLRFARGVRVAPRRA